MFLYEGDAPLAERRAQALSLDTALLAELLGQAELRELLDAGAVAEVEAQLQRLSEDRRAYSVDSTADLLRLLGDLTTAEALARGATPAWLAELEASRRAIRYRCACSRTPPRARCARARPTARCVSFAARARSCR